jgi:hypothetical protein
MTNTKDWEGLEEISPDYKDMKLTFNPGYFTATFIYQDGTSKAVDVSLPKEAFFHEELDYLQDEVTDLKDKQSGLMQLLEAWG